MKTKRRINPNLRKKADKPKNVGRRNTFRLQKFQNRRTEPKQNQKTKTETSHEYQPQSQVEDTQAKAKARKRIINLAQTKAAQTEGYKVKQTSGKNGKPKTRPLRQQKRRRKSKS